VINREYTVWELYKWRIMGLFGLVIVGALLLVVLIRVALVQRRHIKQLAHQSAFRWSWWGWPTRFVLRVSDDGFGFNTHGYRSELGMTSMRERIRLVGGTFTVFSIPSLGTQVEAAISLSTKTSADKSRSPVGPSRT